MKNVTTLYCRVNNGQALSAPLLIEEGMVVSVGNPAKGISKFPLVLRLAA